MILSFLNKLRVNKYVRLILLLASCYVIFNAFAFDRIDYILILYILYIPNIDEDTALPYAFVFGLFYDLNYQIFLGLGVLMFQIFNLIKVHMFQMIDMTKLYSRFLFSVGIIVIYLLLTIKFYGYPASTFWASFAYYFAVNMIAAGISWAVLGRRYAFSHS